MKRVGAGWLALGLLLPRVALGQVPPVVAVPAGDDVIVAVRKGEAAPFAGQLFDQPTALRWANYLEQYRARAALEAQYQARWQALETQYQTQALDAERQAHARALGELDQKLLAARKELDSPPFYRTVWFGVGLGALAMGAAVGLAAFGLHEAR